MKAGISTSRVLQTALAGAICVLLLPAGAQADITKRNRVTTFGLGPLKIGMTVQRAERVVGHPIHRTVFNAPCFTARIPPTRLGVWVLGTGSVIGRIDVIKRGIATRSGIRVGDSVARLRRIYRGQLHARPNFYARSKTDYVIRDGRRKVVFFTNNRKVTSYSTGRAPEINYVEGCA